MFRLFDRNYNTTVIPRDRATKVMLSEKAKGKQRAIEPYNEQDEAGQTFESKSLVVRFTEGIEDLRLDIEEKDTVRDLKRKVS